MFAALISIKFEQIKQFPFMFSTSVHAGLLKNTLPETQLLPEVKWEKPERQMGKERSNNRKKRKTVGGVEERRAEYL